MAEQRQKSIENYYKEQNDRIKANEEAQDKMIITLSVALFGLLSFFYDKLLNNEDLKCLLIALVVFDVLSLIFTLSSFICCGKGNKKDLEYARKYYEDDDKEYKDKQSWWTTVGSCFNLGSLVMMVITLVLFATMLILSIIGTATKISYPENRKDLAMKKQTIRIQDGSTSAKMPPLPPKTEKPTPSQQDQKNTHSDKK